jgi:hypothetical protein
MSNERERRGKSLMQKISKQKDAPSVQVFELNE